MAHITLSIPDKVYSEMKQHPEIKWSEVARKSITEKIRRLQSIMHASELLSLLPPETQQNISRADQKESATFAKEVRKKGWKRAKYLTQA